MKGRKLVVQVAVILFLILATVSTPPLFFRASGKSIESTRMPMVASAAPIPVVTTTTSDLNDSFDGTVLNTCKWDNRSYNGGQVNQDGELIASVSADYNWSGAKVFTQYQLIGDFDVQVDFRAGLGWTDLITPSGTNPHLDGAAMGIFVDEPHWIHITRIIDSGGNILGLYSNIPEQGMLASVANDATAGKYRIVRTGSNITFKYDTGMGWQDLHTVSAFTTPIYIYFYAGSVDTHHAFTTYFDNFIINSGATSYTPLVWNDQFQRRPDFYVGGVVCDYLAKRVWDQYWKEHDPLQTLKENGFQWVRVGVLTTSSQYLRDTPPSEWDTLPWRDEYWSSLEYAEQILREASDRGLRLNLFFFLSDKAAHGARQDAPPEWAGLSVTDTATVLETYTYSTTRYFLDRGLNIELYDIGNEIEWGILNFRPGERIALPPGVDVTTNMDYMRNNVWNIEATLLKSAISGVKRADPDAKIVLHIGGLGISPGDLLVKSFFQTMVNEGVEFDYASLSHPYPFTGWSLPNYSTYCWFQRLQGTIDFLASLGKKVIFSEAGYPHDTPGIEGEPMRDFPYTPTGQAAWVRDQLRFTSNSENVVGFFYFYPEWFPGMSTDPSTLNLQSSGLFASDTQVEPAMEEFQVNLATRYVYGATGSDTTDCTNHASPCATIGYALDQAADGDTILVATGTYTENLVITKTVTLAGGYEPVGWSQCLRRCMTTINGNQSGRVIDVQSTLSETTVIDGFTITNGDGGIGILLSSVAIRNSKIVDNHATEWKGGSGGGMRIDHSFVTITNTLIADNRAASHDGAIRIISTIAIPGPNSAVTITNSTIANNRADEGRNGIFCSLSSCDVVNSIVWGHEGEDFAGHGYHATYSDIEMGLSGEGNISEDPRFVDPASGDYHLRSDSPCIDKGTNEGAPETDFEGDQRPFEGGPDGSAVVDMGADETAAVLLFGDEFDGNELDPAKWDVIQGLPTVEDGKLSLPGGATRAEIQSKAQFQYGVLQTAIESSDWTSQTGVTDSSFGFEVWTGANGQCHYGVILIANGHLGVLRSLPDADDNCSGDPLYQAYLPISNWDVVRAAGTVYLTLTWSPDGVTLHVSDGGSNSGLASYTGEAAPAVPLEIRLNADVGEIYRVDYVRVYQDPAALSYNPGHMPAHRSDLDWDRDVDVTDIMMVAAAWRAERGESQYRQYYDLHHDGGIDIVDIMLVASRWGETFDIGPHFPLCYSPYRPGQAPGGLTPSPLEIGKDMEIIEQETKLIRTYGACGEELAAIPGIANGHGIDVHQGVKLTSIPSSNDQEMDCFATLVAEHQNIVAGVIGNETLQFDRLSESALVDYIEQAKVIGNVPVTTGEPWNVWCNEAETKPRCQGRASLGDAVDFVLAHSYPCWECVPTEHGAAHIVATYITLREVYTDRVVVIGETGWPTCGECKTCDNGQCTVCDNTIPSPENQSLFIEELWQWANLYNMPVLYFEALDEEWKAAEEGEVGRCWGLYDANRTPKHDNLDWSIPTPEPTPTTPSVHIEHPRDIATTVTKSNCGIPIFGRAYNAEPGWHVKVEVFTNDWYIQDKWYPDGLAPIIDDMWSMPEIMLGGQGGFNNHSIRATLVDETGAEVDRDEVTGIVRTNPCSP